MGLSALIQTYLASTVQIRRFVQVGQLQLWHVRRAGERRILRRRLWPEFRRERQQQQYDEPPPRRVLSH